MTKGKLEIKIREVLIKDPINSLNQVNSSNPEKWYCSQIKWLRLLPQRYFHSQLRSCRVWKNVSRRLEVGKYLQFSKGCENGKISETTTSKYWGLTSSLKKFIEQVCEKRIKWKTVVKVCSTKIVSCSADLWLPRKREWMDWESGINRCKLSYIEW